VKFRARLALKRMGDALDSGATSFSPRVARTFISRHCDQFFFHSYISPPPPGQSPEERIFGVISHRRMCRGSHEIRRVRA
jgi:hypothetical protein